MDETRGGETGEFNRNLSGPASGDGLPERGRTARARETMEQAKTVARNVGEQARAAASNAGAAAQDIAKRVREHPATDALYQQGTRAGEYVSRGVSESPWTALLIAGAIGYGLAYLVHGR